MNVGTISMLVKYTVLIVAFLDTVVHCWYNINCAKTSLLIKDQFWCNINVGKSSIVVKCTQTLCFSR